MRRPFPSFVCALRWSSLALLLAVVGFVAWRHWAQRRARDAVDCLASCLLGPPLAAGEAPGVRLHALMRSVPTNERFIRRERWPALCTASVADVEAQLGRLGLDDSRTLTARVALNDLGQTLSHEGTRLSRLSPPLAELRRGMGDFGDRPAAEACPRAPARQRYEFSTLVAQPGAPLRLAEDVVALDQESSFWLLGEAWPRGEHVRAGLHVGAPIFGERARRAAPVAWQWFLLQDELPNRIYVDSSRRGLASLQGIDLDPVNPFCIGVGGEVVGTFRGRLARIDGATPTAVRGGETVPAGSRFVRDQLIYQENSGALMARRLSFEPLQLEAPLRVGSGELVEYTWKDDCLALALGTQHGIAMIAVFDGSRWWRRDVDVPAENVALACMRGVVHLSALSASGSLSRAACTPDNCDVKRSSLGELDASAPPVIAQIGDATWLVWRTREGDVRLRVVRDGAVTTDRLLFADMTGAESSALLIAAQPDPILLWSFENPVPLSFAMALGPSTAHALDDGNPKLRTEWSGGALHLEWQGGSLWRASADEAFRLLANSTGPSAFHDAAVVRGESYTYCVSRSSTVKGSAPPECLALSFRTIP
ncbi:MAG: hypothetical protein QM756_35800 [Polyangiaceae bacterium]